MFVMRMRRRILVLMTTLWLFIAVTSVVLPISFPEKPDVYARQISPTPAVSTTAAPATHTPSSNGFDFTPFAPIISLVGVVMAALIGACVTLYLSQRRRTIRLEKEKADIQLRLEKEKADIQLELERERIRFQETMNAERAEKERQRQRKEMNDESVRIAMERAQTMAERIQAYRDALQVDPRIAKLQILDMSHPLDVTNIFVQVRLHQEVKPGYELDPLLLAAQSKGDPNELLHARRLHLEKRVSTSINPDDAIVTYKRCVFVGDPGAGKTTLLKYLALQSSQKRLKNLPDFPIHIELNAFATSGYHDLVDFASRRWEDRYSFPQADARACMDEHLKNGKALLLLDGLDETAIGASNDEADVSYKRIIDLITELTTLYHQSPVV